MVLCIINSQSKAATYELSQENSSPTTVTETYYVAITGTGTGGLSWTQAFTNVQDALAVATEPSEIWVAKGVYYPDEGSEQIDNSITATFVMTNGVVLYGGFEFNDTDINDRDWENNLTILSGDIDKNDIKYQSHMRWLLILVSSFRSSGLNAK